jgi:hypothetical protein
LVSQDRRHLCKPLAAIHSSFFSREFSENIHELAVDAFVYENCSANMDSLVEFCTGSPITQGKQVNLKRTMGRGGAFQVGVPFCVPGQSFSRAVPVMFRVLMFPYSWPK